MRVAIDCRYVRERPSGIGAYVRALIDRIPQRAPDDQWLLWAHPRAPNPLSPASNVRHVTVRAQANNIPWLWFPRLWTPLDGIDLVHAPSNILARGIPCPSVVTVHDLMWLLTPEMCERSALKRIIKSPFYRDGIGRALREATRIVAISRATADAIQRVDPRAASRTEVIHHGVESRFQPPRDRAAAMKRCEALGAKPPFLLVVGQNAPYKNQQAIVKAFAAADRPKDLSLVFVHRFAKGSALSRAVIDGGVQERVTWLEKVTDADVIALMQSAMALVQFSRVEGFGMPALEAMACGTPVIASDISVLSEVLGPAGVKVPLRISELADAIGKLSRDAAWRDDLSALGLERAKDFTWDVCAEKHLEIYRDALNV
jgi:glycosyltransferase involved in cell wall biosynthesis